MSPTTRTLFIIFAAVLGAALLAAGGVWYWWRQNSAEFLDAGAVVITEGQTIGRGLDEAGCMAGASERHKTAASRHIGAAVNNNLWLTACLEASKVKEKFCDGVPAADNLLALGTWAGTRCVQQGYPDPYCGILFGAVPKYCSSSERAKKLDKANVSRPSS